jgi:hypothetical protein
MDYREKTKGTIKNEQSRYTGNIWYTRQGLRQAKKKKKNATQKTNFVKTRTPPTTGDEPSCLRRINSFCLLLPLVNLATTFVEVKGKTKST